MAILLILPGKDAGDAAAVLRAREPELDVRVWPDCGKAVDIELALVWNHPMTRRRQAIVRKRLTRLGGEPC